MLLRPGRARKVAAVALAAGLLSSIPGVASADSEMFAPPDLAPRLNHMQVVGSHNSFHQEITGYEKELRRQIAGDQTEIVLEYTASAMGTQLGPQKVRQIEFDVFADPSGGMYYTPYLRTLAGLGSWDPIMQRPGTKVLHLQDVDYKSHCLTLVRCLQQVKAWSDHNARHIPIAIMLEFEDFPLVVPGETAPRPGTVIPLPWTRDRMLALEREILTVFPRDRLVTPDSVRTPGKTLEQSVLQDGWPTIDSTRGKILFLMDNDGVYRDEYIRYNPNLEGRLLFTNSRPGVPDAAFMKRYVWDSVTEITSLVSRGYMVRTRADRDTIQARANDTSTRDTALASGAQWVSTDYPAPGMAQRFGSPYFVEIPGGKVARCNPVSGPSTCRSEWLEPSTS